MRSRSPLWYGACVILALTSSGCVLWPNKDGTEIGIDTGDVVDAITGTEREPFEPDPFDDSDDVSIGTLSWDGVNQTWKNLTGKGRDREIAKQRYRAADDLYRQAIAAEETKKAEIFELAAAKFDEAAERWPDSALAMDALFMCGEAHFFADNYPDANEAFEKLVKAFPNNRYLDVVDRRRFAMARYWLELNRESPESSYYVNFFDKTRPWKDARGHGLRVFDKIRVDDPTGRLADDATLAAANEHFLAGKFVQADEYYTDLRTQFPSSEHQFLAHFLGLKAKLGCYQGPAYGGTSLEEAEKLIKQIRRQFPQEAEKEREFLERSAAEIRFRKAERLDFLAKYYDRRGEYRAAEHYYARVVREYQDTPLAVAAEERVGQIAGLPPVPPQVAEWLVNLFPESDDVKPLLEATQRQQGLEQQGINVERVAEGTEPDGQQR